jgi:hypothetical protein
MLPHRIFGCVVYVYLHKNQRNKLDPCAFRCLFLGYATHQKGYRCYDPTTQRTYMTMDVTFLEPAPFYPSSISTTPLQGETLDEELKWLTFEWFEDQNGTPSEEPLATEPIPSEEEPLAAEPIPSEEEPLAAEPIPFEEEESPRLLVAASSSPENIPEVSNVGTPSIINAIDTGYNLPFRQNQGKPPNRYSS